MSELGMNIEQYLAQHQKKDLLRFLTCGNVDDGKSTLIGRLLHDSKMIYEDQLAAIRADSTKYNTTGGDEIDLALLVDGLQAEREQGITIDVAYRYFSTDKRKFIIADTPGHEQYTRNMATGASTCDLAIILIDARNGVQTQTKRHTFIASLLGIKHIVVAINKMDAVSYQESVFDAIKADYQAFSSKLLLGDVAFIPLSALRGDNVVHKSDKMPWYDGPTLLYHLENVPLSFDQNLDDLRFPVQWVNRPNLDFRGYCGTVASGVIKAGDEILILPSKKQNRVKSVIAFEQSLPEASSGMAITVTLEKETDISRGDVLVRPESLPHVGTSFEAMLVWMNEQPLTPQKPYLIKHSTKLAHGTVSSIQHRVNINTLEEEKAEELKLNEIAKVSVQLSEPIAFDEYQKNRATGAFIIIDRLSNNTVGAGMILGPDATHKATTLAQPTEKIEALSLASTYLHLDESRATPIGIAGFWPQLLSGNITDPKIAKVAAGGWLVASFTMQEDTPNWEMHPEGDEILLLTSGEVEVILEEANGAVRSILLQAGMACVVPRGVWHRQVVKSLAHEIALTFGAGTQHRPV